MPPNSSLGTPSIGLFYGSNTGQTENVARDMQTLLQAWGHTVTVYDMEFADVSAMAGHTHLILGTPTWHNGGGQYSWLEQWEQFATINLTGKHIACFGLGDSQNYAEWYLDYMGDIYHHCQRAGGIMAGAWSAQGYYVMSHKALTADKSHYVGLALDTLNHPDMTDIRIHQWLCQLMGEWGMNHP